MSEIQVGNDLLKGQKPTLSTYLALLVVSFGSISYGYSAAVIGLTLGQPSFITRFNLATRTDTTDLISTMNGLYFAGGVIGAMSLPTVADKYGRKWACAFPAIIAIISGALLTGSVNVGMFIAFRFFAGASAFMLLAAVPLYTSEVVPAHARGLLVAAHGATLSVGYVLSGWIGVGFYYWRDQDSWIPPMALQCVWPIIMLAGLYFLPESPRWLIMQDRTTEAESILYNLHGGQHGHDAALAEFYQIRKQIAIDRLLGNSWMHIIKQPSYRKRAIFALCITGFIQCAGPLVINNYGPSIYASLGFSTTKQLVYPAAWLTHGTGMEYLGLIIVDRLPRNRLIAFGLLGCSICISVEAALTAKFVPSNNEAALTAAVAMFFIWFIFYGLCLECTQFAYITEIFPNHLRAKGTCLGISMIALMNIIWLQAAPTAFKTIGWRFYLPFIILCAIGSVIMWVYFPDTRRMALEEVAALFGDEDEIAVYQKDIVISADTHAIMETKKEGDYDNVQHFEQVESNKV